MKQLRLSRFIGGVFTTLGMTVGAQCMASELLTNDGGIVLAIGFVASAITTVIYYRSFR